MTHHHIAVFSDMRHEKDVTESLRKKPYVKSAEFGLSGGITPQDYIGISVRAEDPIKLNEILSEIGKMPHVKGYQLLV